MGRNARGDGEMGALKRLLPAVGFGLGVLCLLAMVPVTLGALAGLLTLGAAVPILGAAMALSLFSLVVSNR